ncbi:hypothetical protein WJX73_005311 [Symbiochloris irregularis]|uniref:Major facilitator superfamily (MFS) profile domain-containing protein n=1 Tax=Symbiochloris irregularis TaxID=706552 RepID=A0AAW1NZM1_9CHLO
MLVRVAIFAALGGFLYGYDLGLIGGAMLSMRDEIALSTEATQVVVAAAKAGGFFGTFLGGGAMLYYGRRTTIALDSLFFMVGPITMAAATGLWGLVLGRFLIGMGIDAALQNAPNNWRWMVGLPVVPGLVLSAAMWMLPESPRWLVVNGRLDEALAVIHVMYTNATLPLGVQASTAEVEHELLELWSSVEKDKEAVRERALLARQARLSRRGGRASKQARKERGDRSEWQQLQLQDVHSPDPAVLAQMTNERGATDARDPRQENGGTELRPHEAAPLQAVAEETSTSDTQREPRPGDPEGSHASPAVPGAQGLRISVARLPPFKQEEPDGGSPSQPHTGLHRQLSDPTSPLYRSLSEIPNGLAPIRTTSFSEEGEGGSASATDRGADPGKAWRSAASGPRQRGAPGHDLTAAHYGFWSVQWGVMVDMWHILWGPEARAVRLALWIAVIDQAMASTAIINYAPDLIQRTSQTSNLNATLWTSCVTGAKIVGSVASMFLVDSAGRRPLLIGGSALCGAALLLLAVADHLHSTGLVVTAMCIFILSFSGSYAGVFWVLLSELFSMAAKAPAASLATAVLFAAGAVADLIFLSMHDLLGPVAFVLFAAVAFAGVVYCALHLPETKGRTLAQVQALLGGKEAAATAEGPPVEPAAHAEEMIRPTAPGSGRAIVRQRSPSRSRPQGEEMVDVMEQGHAPMLGGLRRQWEGYSRFEGGGG